MTTFLPFPHILKGGLVLVDPVKAVVRPGWDWKQIAGAVFGGIVK